MDKTRSKMKKPFSSSFFLILIFLIFSTTGSITASECQIEFNTNDHCSMTDNEIEEEIKYYLSNNSLYPILTDNQMKYEIIDIFEDSNKSIVYTAGMLSEGENSLITLFSIQKNWFWNTTELVYMTTDIPPSPLLFTDICLTAASVLPKSPSNYHVLIQKVENEEISAETKLQHWIFFNRQECIELLLILVDDQHGGTDFAVMTWPE